MDINDSVKNISQNPGVYFFKDKQDQIIYIGKAKNLKKRVSSYFGKSHKDRKTSQIKFLTDRVETFTTKNEVEALLLEQMLIKENKPKYNILLRDDKTFPYIAISKDRFPKIYSTRKINHKKEEFFGPYTIVKSMR